MKILLIEPNIKTYALLPTMSLAVLKGFINEKTRHEAKIIDLVFHKKDWKKYLVKKIGEEKPDLIGLSVLSCNYLETLRIAKFVKDNFTAKIIFGGVHVILSPQEVIENELVDIICTGEGEEALKDLLDSNLNCEGIKGVWYKQDGKIIKNENRRLIENLDVLVFPDFDDFDLEKYFVINHSHLPIMASRGCPYVCSYCSNHALSKALDGKYVRFRSVGNVIEEIELRIKQLKKGLKYLYFYDDTFILYKDFVMEFCKNFKDKGFHRILKWNINVRANLVTDEIIKTMKDAGCYQVRMGVEAGNDYIRNKVYKRDITNKQIVDAFRIIKDNGLQLRLYFIIGAPYETVEMMEESFDMAKRSNADEIFFGELLPLPGTEIKDVCEKENLLVSSDSENYKHVMGINPVSKTKYASRKQIQRFALKIKRWQVQRYIREGFDMNGLFFLWDVLLFLLYYKCKYDFELNQVYRWNVQKNKLSRI